MPGTFTLSPRLASSLNGIFADSKRTLYPSDAAARALGFRKSVVSHAKPTYRALGLQKSFSSFPNGRRRSRRRGRRRAESPRRPPHRLEMLNHRCVAFAKRISLVLNYMLLCTHLNARALVTPHEDISARYHPINRVAAAGRFI